MPINRLSAAFSLFLFTWLMPSPVMAAESMHDGGDSIFHMFRLETDEGFSRDQRVTTWDVKGWIGGDDNKLWLKTEGTESQGNITNAQLWTLYSRNISTFWDAQIGLRADFKPRTTTYLAMGFNGLAPYFFDTEAHLFVSQRGDVSARLRGETDFLWTQKLITQPYAEIHLSAQKVPTQNLGAGPTEATIGLQTRYEITRAFAPYIDLNYGRKFGETSVIAQRNGEGRDALAASIGLRILF